MADLRENTWMLDEWYAQDVAGDVSYSGATSTWDTGASAMLGINLTGGNHRSSPVQVPGTNWGGPSSLASIKLSGGVGENFRMWIKSDGTLWGAGSATKVGSTHPSFPSWSSPRQVGTGTDWLSLSTSWAQTAATKTDGTLWTWGEANYGELGHNNNAQPYSSPKQVPGTTWGEWVGTSSAANVTMNIKTDGTLWAVGYGDWGGLGQNQGGPGYRLSSPIQIPGDWSSPLDMVSKSIIKSDGTMWTWGNNRYGQLGLNEGSAPSYKKHRSSPTQLPGTWSRVARNYQSQLAIKSDGTLWGMGNNNYGQTGQNNLTQYSSPTQVGTDTTWKDIVTDIYAVLAIKTDNTLWAWGDGGAYGTIGNNTRNIDYSSPVQLPGEWKGIAGTNTYGWTSYKDV